MSGQPIKKLFMFTCPATSHRTTLPCNCEDKAFAFLTTQYKRETSLEITGTQRTDFAIVLQATCDPFLRQKFNLLTYIRRNNSRYPFDDIHENFILPSFLKWQREKQHN